MDKQMDQKSAKSGGSIFHRLAYKQAAEDCSLNDDKVPHNISIRSMESTADALSDGISSSSVNGDAFVNSGDYVRDHGSLLSLQPWIFKKGNHLRDEEILNVNGMCSEKCEYATDCYMSNSLPKISPQSVSLGYAHARGQSYLRTRRSRRSSNKTFSSMDNCLIPQLYNENFEIEEFVFSSFPPSTRPGLRPFVVTDGSNIISKSSYVPVDVSSEIGMDKVKMEKVSGVSPLPKLRTPKRKSRETPHEKLGSSNIQRARKVTHHKDSLDGVHTFSIGFSLGIICTILSYRKEIESLNNLLKSSENLVQDLQEELEMKDTLTVKELSNEACGHQKPSDSISKLELIESAGNQVSTSYCPADNVNENKQLNLPMEESRSRIEAELEMELEKLELSMKASSLNGRMSALSELDPDLMADVVHGELKAEMLPGGVSDDQADNASDSRSSSTNHTQNYNYPVSPRELSLRLHEVVRLRLEERVSELERTLQQTQKQLQLVESERLLSGRAFSSSDMGSSSNMDSPTGTNMGEASLAQPFCLNLGGDALHAYNEAYEEFLRVANMEENLPSTTNMNSKHEYSSHLSDQGLMWGLDTQNYHLTKPILEQNLMGKGQINAPKIYVMDDNECNDEDDVEMNMLIEQILERTRQGLPIVQDAQRMLFMDD
ncbi:hypothetical protein Cni_G16511 [Canna indica]|uniref:Pericentriolar material 1 protein n=1 Tax=Canna indica TaxID=4628 RepID=A0AAQ3KIU0_9LILI|nr:hypothetical protein Cni_G16511 [Canna indica]